MSLPIIDIVTENPTEQDCAAIIAPLRQFNRANRGMIEDKPDFAVLVRDPGTREVLGGLYGTDSYGWAFVKYLVVPEQFRGQKLGSHLIEEAEKICSRPWLYRHMAGYFRVSGQTVLRKDGLHRIW